MSSLFRVTLQEIFAGTAWIGLVVSCLALYIGVPIISGAYGEGVVISRGQGAYLGVFLAGVYSVLLGARIGSAQVSRGANLYYRAAGFSEIGRWAGITMACLVPLAIVLVMSGTLFFWNYLSWNNELLGGVWAVFQFSVLSLLLFSMVTSVTVGTGAFFGYGPGVLTGIGIIVVGFFMPPLLSIAASVEPWIEGVWIIMPHLYCLDWSPAVIYLWKAADFLEFCRVFSYGLLWLVVLGTVGGFFFSKSANQHE